MMVLIDVCKECNHTCNAIHFQQNFNSWTSGNNNVDKFIQDIQLLAHQNAKEALEWIPYDRFYDINCSKKTGAYRANWIDGYICRWDNEIQNWKRVNQNMLVFLIYLNNSTQLTLELMNEVFINNMKF
jgi:hypothetical protein